MKTIDVVCAIIVKDNLIFCAQRGEGKTLSFKWEFPGGKIEEDETQIAALKREIKEELGCNIEVDSFFMKSSYEYDFGLVNLYSYLCRLTSEEPVLAEHVSSKWVDKSDLRKLDWARADIPIINKIVSKR